MQTYSETELAMLEALARFQYLTPSQFVSLGLLKVRKSVYRPLAKLSQEHKPSVAKINFTVSPTSGRPEVVHYLTHSGVKRLVEAGYDPEGIKYPKRASVSFASDYKHRIWTVDFFISLHNWTVDQGYEPADFHYYFQQSSGSNRNNKGGSSLSDNRIDLNTGGVE